MKFDLDPSVTRQDALRLMKENWKFTPACELVSLADAAGRVTAEDIFSRNTLPVFRASCFDGIAVNSACFRDGMPDTSAWKQGRDFVRADTGDDFPDAFDTVIAVEDVEFTSEDGVRFRDGFVYDGEVTVDPAGTIVSRGSLLVPAHTRITPEVVVLLAIGGAAWVPVLRKLRVAFLPTGDELVPAGLVPQRGQNVEANSYMVAALLRQWGAEVLCHPVVPDCAADLEAALDAALVSCDMVLINGGSSRGEADFNSRMIERRSTFFRHGVRTVPGRPVGMAIVEGKPVVNLPGPVAAAYLASHWLVCGLVHHYYGLPVPILPRVRARLGCEMRKRPGFELVARVALQKEGDCYTATPVNWDVDLVDMLRRTDGFVTVPAESGPLPAGSEVEVELLKGPECIGR